MEEFRKSKPATAADKYFGKIREVNLYATKKSKSLQFKLGIRPFFKKTFLSVEYFIRGARLQSSSKKYAKKKPGPAEASGIVKEGDVILEVTKLGFLNSIGSYLTHSHT